MIKAGDPATILIEVHVEPNALDAVSRELQKLPEVTDLHEVTGDADLVAVVRSPSIESFRNLLVTKIMKISGLQSATTFLILSTRKRHGTVVAAGG